MAKNILKSVILLSFFLICGCSGNSEIEEIVWGQEVKEEAVRISPEVSYELPDTIYAMSASVYKGRYAVCPLETQEYSAVLYDLQEGRVVNQFLHYGNGPSEVLLPDFYINGDTLCVRDLLKNRFYTVPCADFPDVNIHERKVEFMSADILPYNGQLLALNPYYLENEEMGISNGEEMLFVSDGSEVPYDKSKVFSLNVVQGSLMHSYAEGKVVYADASEPLVVFFDSSLKPLKMIIGPRDYDVRYIEAPQGELSFLGSVCYSYLSASCDDKYVYLLYYGAELDDSEEDVDWEFADNDAYLFQLDWDGNLVGSYQLEGVRFFLPVVSAGAEPGTVDVSTIYPDRPNLQILHFDLDKAAAGK